MKLKRKREIRERERDQWNKILTSFSYIFYKNVAKKKE